jgi:hypothetical protein
LDRGQCRFAVGNGLDVETRLEQPAHILAHIGVVVGEQHPRALAGDARCFRGDVRGRLHGRLVSVRKPAQRFLDKGPRAHRRRRLRVLGADMIGRQMRVTKRDRDGERRPATQPAFDSDRTAVQFTSSCTSASPMPVPS